MIVEPEIEKEENPHGEWLTVTRKKKGKNQQEKNRGISPKNQEQSTPHGVSRYAPKKNIPEKIMVHGIVLRGDKNLWGPRPS